MKIGSKRGYRVAIVAAGALILAGGAVAVADAAHGGKQKPTVVKKHVAKRVVRSGVHADVSLIRADGTTDAFAVDRGKVTASSSTSVTLLRADGKSVTLGLTTTTQSRGMIALNKPLLVFSRNGVAFRIFGPGARLAPQVAGTVNQQKSPVVHIQASFIRADGSTHTVSLDRGQVTASSATSLTIKRGDGQSVTFTLGSSTKVNGHLVVGGKALVLTRDGTVVRVLARGGTATG